MHRRLLLASTTALTLTATATLWRPALAAAASTSAEDETQPAPDAPAAPHITVTLAQMQGALAQRFPLRYPLPGIMDLDLQTPQLQFLPEQNRLGAQLQLLASGPALERRHQGSLGLDFALRYETSDRSVRAYRIRLQRLDFPTLQPGVVAMLRRYGQALGEQALLEVVVHRLSDKDLALTDGLGFQPDSIRVTPQGLRIGFARKPL